MRNTFAVLPLAVALFGGAMLGEDVDPSLRTRLAVSMSAREAVESLWTDDQLAWLDEHNPFGIPRTDVPSHSMLIVRRGYSLSHNNIDLIADWVSFHLTDEYVEGTEKRPGSSAFKPDPALPTGQRAELDDYKGWKSTYDRGHQCASADSRGRGRAVIRESFYLSNITPQASRLNQGDWRAFEAHIQGLARTRGELWVVTGPAFVDDDEDGLIDYYVVGENQVAVPTHYFKIVLVPSADGSSEFEAMAVLVPNHDLDAKMDEFLVSIDEIEEMTALDFFPGLADTLESRLEAYVAEELLT